MHLRPPVSEVPHMSIRATSLSILNIHMPLEVSTRLHTLLQALNATSVPILNSLKPCFIPSRLAQLLEAAPGGSYSQTELGMLPPPGYSEHCAVPYLRAGQRIREPISASALPSGNAMLEMQHGRFVSSIEVRPMFTLTI